MNLFAEKAVSFYFTVMLRFWCLQFTNPNKHDLLILSPHLQGSKGGLLLKNMCFLIIDSKIGKMLLNFLLMTVVRWMDEFRAMRFRERQK